MTPEYIHAEPEGVQGYLDQDGGFHISRDKAVAANVASDLHKAIRKVGERPLFDGMPTLVVRFVEQLIKTYPELVQAYLDSMEDRG